MTNLQNQSDAKLFLIEAWQRFWARSPKYFRAWQLINLGFVGLGFMPDIIKWVDITLPANWILILGKCVSAAGMWAYVNNRFPVSKPTTAIMPFTEKKNIEQAIKKEADNFQPPSGNNKSGL